MLKLIFLRFWPVWLPIIAYLLWLGWAVRRAKKRGEPKPGFFDGPWGWTVIAVLIMLAAMFVLLGLTTEREGEGVYHPPAMKDGVLVPGHVEPPAGANDSQEPRDDAAIP